MAMQVPQKRARTKIVATVGPSCRSTVLLAELSEGDSVMLADGTISLVVLEKTSDHARCRVVQPGLLRSRQGLNLPGVKLSVKSMSEDDWKHALWAAQNQIDFVSLSFVR